MDPKNKVALITGGASGIGFTIAKILLKNSAKGVAIVDINEDEGQLAVQKITEEFGEGKCIFAMADVCNKDKLEDAFKRTVATFNQLDIVYSNAGIANERKWEQLYNINLIGSVNCILLAIDTYLPKYKSTDEGVVFITSSVLGLVPSPSVPHYAASKAALVALTLAFSGDFHFKRTSVKVKTICPSLTVTPLSLNVDALDYGLTPEDVTGGVPTQTVDQLAECAMEILKECQGNGTIWVVEAGEKTKIDYPKLWQNVASPKPN